LRRFCKARRGRYILGAASDTAGAIAFHMHDRDLYGSTFYRELEGASVRSLMQ
jgi:hypothetical protein